MTNTGDKDFEKESQQSKEATPASGEDALESTAKAGQIEKANLKQDREKRKSLGHLPEFSLGSGAVLEITDRSEAEARRVFGFDSRESFAQTPGSQRLSFDENGRLSQVTYPSGLSAEVTYSGSAKNAQPEEIRLSNGTTLERKPDGSWGQTADDSGAVIAKYKKVKITNDGAIRFEGDAGTLVWNPGGTATVTDKQGRLSKVTYPSGLAAEVSYESSVKDAQPNKITLSNDTTLLRQEDGSWFQRTDRSGVVVMEYRTIEVQPNGTIRFDEGELSWNPDGSAISKDDHGRLSKVAYASGLSGEIKYKGADGEPAALNLSNDTTLERNSDGSWSQKTSRSGTLLSQYKNVLLGDDGRITFESEGQTVVWHTDGTTVATDLTTGQRTRLQPDGTRERLS